MVDIVKSSKTVFISSIFGLVCLKYGIKSIANLRSLLDTTFLFSMQLISGLIMAVGDSFV